MPGDKLRFLQHEMFSVLEALDPGSAPLWGKMDAQQMVEHCALFFDVSSGIITYELVTPEDQLPRYKAFLLSDKQFRENTKAPASVLGEEPLPKRYSSLPEAIAGLNVSVKTFVTRFHEDNSLQTVHPAFGQLTFDEWVLLHYKHVTHHMRQFGIFS